MIYIVSILAVIFGIFIGFMLVGIQLGIQKNKYLSTSNVLLIEIDAVREKHDALQKEHLKLIEYLDYVVTTYNRNVDEFEDLKTYIDISVEDNNTVHQDIYDRLNKSPEHRKFKNFKDFFDL